MGEKNGPIYLTLKKFYFSHRDLVDRALEAFPGAFSWAFVTMPFWLSFLLPQVVAYSVILFTIFWFYQSAVFATTAPLAYLRIKAHQEVDWLAEAKKQTGWENLHHVVIIPTYKERLEKLRATLNNLANQDFPNEKISVCLAFEKREGKPAEEKAQILGEEFREKFANVWATFHPDLPGEVKGKASNESYAAREIARKFKNLGVDFRNVTITSCDADSLFPKKYFSYLTHLYLTDEEHDFHFYHAPYLLYNNFWQLPLPIRVHTTLTNVARLGLLLQQDKLIQMSAYSMSLFLLDTIGYWDTDIIPEDWHVFLQAFFYLGDKVKTIPIFLPVTGDASLAPSYFQSLISRYEQERRWAWGVTDVPYTIKQFFRHPEIPLWSRLRLLLYILRSHLLWPVHFFVLTLGATIPALVNPAFKKTVLGYNLPRVAGLILTLASVFLIVITIVDIKARPPKPKRYGILKTPLLYLQWLFLPVISLLFSSLPGLDAHTRLMLNKKLEYKVTEKV